jgi:hypothetical protein
MAMFDELPRVVAVFGRDVESTSAGVHVNTRGLSLNIIIVIR